MFVARTALAVATVASKEVCFIYVREFSNFKRQLGISVMTLSILRPTEVLTALFWYLQNENVAQPAFFSVQLFIARAYALCDTVGATSEYPATFFRVEIS